MIELKIRSIKPSDYYDWLKYKHYAKKIPIVTIAFGLFDATDNLVGVCTYGPPARNLNDGYGLFGGECEVYTLELNRLVVNDGLEKNSLSWFVSQSLKLLKKPCCVVSYADSNNGHHGYIYQATNWVYTGLTSEEKIYINTLSGEAIHPRTVVSIYGTRKIEKLPDFIKAKKENTGKHRYLFFCGSKAERKIMKSKLKYPVCEYPKGNNKNYDASYSPSIQSVLF